MSLSKLISQAQKSFKLDLQAIYICDNGRMLCGQHLGDCASLTGRDLSGQEIMKLTDKEIEEEILFCHYRTEDREDQLGTKDFLCESSLHQKGMLL